MLFGRGGKIAPGHFEGMNQICIIGCGLIGGSFAALVKKHHPDLAIQGIGRREEPLKAAQERGIIDDYALDINTSKIQTADIIVIASPIATVLPIISNLTATINETKTIIEFSSVKSFLNDPVVTNSHHTIIGMHPMGGLDVQGLENAAATVLENCPMIVFNEDPINSFIASCSFNLISCPSYDIHDEWMMHVSHGPYILASVLPNILSKKSSDERRQLQSVSAGGFRDTTRVSNSAIEWGLDVLTGNKKNAIAFIDQITHALTQLKAHLENDQQSDLSDWLTAAKTTRSTIVN